MTHDTRTFDGMGETAQTMVRTSQESARIFTDDTVKAQELFGKAEEQADVYRSFFGQWGKVPTMRLPFSGVFSDFMFPFQRQGMRLVESGIRNSEEVIETATSPTANYDDKNVEEISARLDGLSAEQIRHLRSYDTVHKNRQSLIDRFDNKLRAS